MFCKQCGANIADGDKFCASCGSVSVPDNNNQNQYNQNQNNQGQYNQNQYDQNQYGQNQYNQDPYNQNGFGGQGQFGQNPQDQKSSKSKLAAGLLGIFLGAYGVHNFYLGFTSKAVLQLILTICTCGLAGLWGFIEGILYLAKANGFTTDSEGKTLSD